MSDPVFEAAQALVPLLAVGADGAIAEVARQAGEGAAAAARRVIEAIRGSIDEVDPSEEQIAQALRSGLANGDLAQADLVPLAEMHGAGRDNHGVQVEGNAYMGNSINVEGDFHG
jgi:hypothetical protein